MNYKSLFYGYSILIVAFGYYKFNKWSLKGKSGIENPDLYSRPQTKLQNFNSWTIIFCLLLAAIVNFYRAVGTN